MKTFASVFTGGGGADLGAMAAGYRSLWGIELMPAIAQVAHENLESLIICGNVLDVDPHTLPHVDLLHASPPCPNFSVANSNAGETELDKALARKVAGFVKVLQPRFFTLENVLAYRLSESWQIILNVLWADGYWVAVDHLNAADFGVPQTRRRMVARAVKNGFVPQLPAPVDWVGWYAAIEDLLPDLPNSQFAAWQIKRLPKEAQTTLFAQGGYNNTIVQAQPDDPAFTITSNSNQTSIKAYLLDSQNTGQEFGKKHRTGDEPSFTVTTRSKPSAMPKAWVGGANTSEAQAKPGVGVSMANEPTRAVNASNAQFWRGWLDNGRVVAMTPRALARFQAFPNSYLLPDQRTLACKIIGNAVPPLLYEQVANTFF